MLRGIVAGAATAMGVLALTGCASSSDPVADTQPTGSATGLLVEDEFIAAVSDAERSARSVSMDMRIGGPDTGEQMRLAGKLHHGQRPSDIAMDFTVSGSVFPVPLSVIVVNEAMYLRMGVVTDDKYVKYDLRDPSSPMGDLLGGIQLDPTAQVRGFRGAIEGFQVGGTQRLDNVDTNRYSVTVDTTKLLANLETTADAVFGATAEPPEQLTYEFWVGTDRLPRRISFTIAGVTTQMDMTSWGEPVDIKAPPPLDITKQDPFAERPSLPRV